MGYSLGTSVLEFNWTGFVRTGYFEATGSPMDGEDVGSQGFLISNYYCIPIWWHVWWNEIFREHIFATLFLKSHVSETNLVFKQEHQLKYIMLKKFLIFY